MIDPSSPATSTNASFNGAASSTEIASAAIARAEPPLVHADALPAGTKLGEFEILSLLGVGGFGMVYRAYDHSLHRTVAIKEYMPSAMAGRSQGLTMATRSSTDQQTLILGLRSFVSEARLLAQFDHPSLVKVYRFWEGNNTAYMAMPLYRGMTLRQARTLLRTPPSEEWLRTVLWAILGALKYLHEHNIVHRDVSPDNIFLQEVGPPVLLDLGAARRTITDSSSKHTAILKVNYAPIEQYAGAGDMRQGPWTDLYSVAAVVHGCLCNEPPLPATFRVLRDRMPTFTSVAKTVESHFGQTYSSDFVLAIEHAMAIQPQNRPQSVQAFCDEMKLSAPGDIQEFVWADGMSVFSPLMALASTSTTGEAKKPLTSTADMSPTVNMSDDPERTMLMPSLDPAGRIEGVRHRDALAIVDVELSTLGETPLDSVIPGDTPGTPKAGSDNVKRWVLAGAACLALAGIGLWKWAGPSPGLTAGNAASASKVVVPESGPGSETIIQTSPAIAPGASAAGAAAASEVAAVKKADVVAAQQAASAASAASLRAVAPNAAASSPSNPASAPAKKAGVAVAKLPAPAPAPATVAGRPNAGAPVAASKPDVATPGVEQRTEAAVAVSPPRPTAPAAGRLGPQAACAEANFLTRPMCIFNECEKPENTRLAFCVENRKRLQETNRTQYQ